ncbi:hypothetical protein OQA88_12347 [Cercophora sp. LCS_1]
MSKPTRILRAAHPPPTLAPRSTSIPRFEYPNLPPPAPTTQRPPTRQQTLTFTPSYAPRNSSPSKQPPNPDAERKVKLGKTLRTLQTNLPTLLQTPLPQAILSPNITLHLFPSTHPHLPVVTGRVAYVAALWSSPIAWNRVPLIGNVRLEILSERMVAEPLRSRPAGAAGEQLVVRWRTASGSRLLDFLKNGNKTEGEHKAPVGDARAVGEAKGFTGLFIFDFDGEGRILSHTIEHVQEGGQWERGVGAKVVGLTDWLLGGMKGGEEGHCPAFTRRR